MKNPSSLGWIGGVIILAAAVLAAPSALAGPPFLTDDPEPVDYQHWEVYGFTTGIRTRDDTTRILPGIEVNYGAVPDVQLHAILPLAYDRPADGGAKMGYGDTELGVKYRVVTPGDDDWFPQVGVFPLVELPTGNADRGLGSGHTRVFLPVWLQKDFDPWTSYGGGGYWTNPGAGNKNYWFVGWLLQRQITKTLALGGEIFRQTADTVGGRDSSGFNVGGIFDVTEHYHLLFSAGRGIQAAAATNAFSYYLGFQWTF